MIGWMRTTVARSPLNAPTAAPRMSAAGTITQGEDRPSCVTKTAMTMALTNPITGPTETSMPPRPAEQRGRGCEGGPDQRRREADHRAPAARHEARRVEDDVHRKQNNEEQNGEAGLRDHSHAARPNMAAITASVRIAAPFQTAGESVVPEHQHAIRQQQNLLDLARQDDERHAAAREIAEHAVQRLPGCDIHAARGVVEQQHPRVERQRPCEQHLLLVAAGERGDGRVNIGRHDGKALAIDLVAGAAGFGG